MSGPALRKVDSHSAIHEAALNEAAELTELLSKLVKGDHTEKAKELAYVLIELWESRILQHANSEEEGLYKEIIEEQPELRDDIVALTRDHNLLRILVKEIKEILKKSNVDNSILQQFQALIIIDELHNRKEMEVLPDHDH
ncbi:hemerythrin domain-containing protein [Virgibacillus ihumii]|uniref:hemerythrin domain-containing protein n=1 Tax=Virgibacillus ihumii TaxID=2686091 RepID=UPI00157DE8B2|nr:hemerythrin domain-containing protein [Virgibacillus ihumii]